MANSFDGRPRVRLCAVESCSEETAQHIDLNVGDRIVRRVHLCVEHLEQNKAGSNLLLSPVRVALFMIGRNEASGFDTLRAEAQDQGRALQSEIARLEDEVKNQATQIRQLREDVAARKPNGGSAELSAPAE